VAAGELALAGSLASKIRLKQTRCQLQKAMFNTRMAVNTRTDVSTRKSSAPENVQHQNVQHRNGCSAISGTVFNDYQRMHYAVMCLANPLAIATVFFTL
jgi:hypothetical protein